MLAHFVMPTPNEEDEARGRKPTLSSPPHDTGTRHHRGRPLPLLPVEGDTKPQRTSMTDTGSTTHDIVPEDHPTSRRPTDWWCSADELCHVMYDEE
ncbi:hypothetical protein CPLU01_05599 [Colletotrichum plurivorum]|uniref:Uncharacterized protein n=1 Tax=Colletotrichum plurivorum TaxID=2175906 RepID=A0A8H6NI34_9PEZI|nr:hypothetical protein CPLU01_05599 [Colletotrichum plurivorum]